MSIATAIVALIDGVAERFSLTTFCIITVTTSTIAGILFDKQLVFDITSAIYTPFADAIVAVWNTISKPSNLVTYGLVYLLVTVFPQLPDAIKAVVLKGQKL